MKKLFYMISVAAFMASFSSCGKLEQENTPADNLNADGTTTLKISATVPQTKTYINNNEVKWVSGDFIQIFAEDGSYKFTDKVPSASSTYDFTVTDWPADKTPVYSVYAGQDAQLNSPVTYVDGVFTATVPSSQRTNNKGSFAKTANLSVGELVDNGTSYSVMMKNVGGLFKYTISSDRKVTSVKIEDVQGAALTGQVNVTLENGIPKVAVEKGNSSVEMKAKISLSSAEKVKYEKLTEEEKDAIVNLFPESDFYACVLPGTYTLKVTVTFTDGTTNVLEAKSPVTVKRNEWIDLGVIDEVITDDGGDEPITPDPSETLTITLQTPYPFTDNLPTSKGTKTKDEYTLKNSDYKFVLYNPNDGYYLTSSCLRISTTKDKSGYIQFPAISGYKLTKFEITGGNGTNGKDYYVYANDPIEVTSNNEPLQHFKLTSNDPKVVDMVGTSEGVGYFLESHSTNAQFTKLVLTYTK